MEELGYKGFVVEPWYGFMVPQGSPRAAIERLNAAFNAAIRSPRIKARLEEAGLRLIGARPSGWASRSAVNPSPGPRWSRPTTSRSSRRA